MSVIAGESKTINDIKKNPQITLKSHEFPLFYKALHSMWSYYSGKTTEPQFLIRCTKEELGWGEMRLRKMSVLERNSWAMGTDAQKKILDEKFKMQEERLIFEEFKSRI